MNKARDRTAVIAMTLLLLGLALYVGSYFVLLSPHNQRERGGTRVALRMAEFHIPYEFGPPRQWLKALYWPLLKLDYELRPDYWAPGRDPAGVRRIVT